MLVREVDRAVEALGLARLVAASGGVDSTVLACALGEIARQRRLELVIGHVNHGLRGAASDADEQAVRDLAASLGAPVEVVAAHPRGLRSGRSSRERPTLQEAARTLRYRALRSMATRLGAERIATAHNADDQAETLLLRLLRGTGPDGLGGIPERSPDGVIVRPLLRVPRAEIEAYARARKLAWREDASNHSLDYTRNRLRHHWLPGLQREFNPRLLRVVADLAEAQRRDSEWIEAQVEREAGLRLRSDGEWLRIDAMDWSQLPEALARRLVRRALRRCGAGRHASRVHLERMGEFLRAGRVGSHIEIPGGLRLERDAVGCRLGPAAPRGPGGVVEPGSC
jgi:tRNA(Ile)-lysidine synthase